MKNLLFGLSLSVLLFVSVDAFKLKSNYDYHNSTRKGLSLTCDDTAWSAGKKIAFYKDKDILFHSGTNEKSPLVASLKDGKTVVLVDGVIQGWENLFCIINSVRSENTITIPYIEGVKIRSSTPDLVLGRKVTLTCDGYVRPDKNVTVVFKYEDKIVARVRNSQVSMGNTPGLAVDFVPYRNNSVDVTPQVPYNYGNYYCSLQFNTTGTPPVEAVSSNVWQTEGSKSPSVHSKVSTNTTYYTDTFPYILVSCDNNTWNDATNIQFFNDKLKLFDSTPGYYSPYATQFFGNTSVLIRSDSVKGWNLLSCSINRTKPENYLQIPRLTGPQFFHTPRNFQLGTLYTFKCPGYLSPEAPITITYTFNGTTMATFKDGKLTTMKVPGLEISQYNGLNDTISVRPYWSQNNGTYSCAFTFNTVGGYRTESVAGWNTSSAGRFSVSVIAILTASLVALFCSTISL